MSWNVWNRPSWSFMVDMRISSTIMKSPSPRCYMTFWDMTIYNDTLNWSDITPIWELITELDFITDFDLITKLGLLLRTPGSVSFWTCICTNVETILSWTCHVYGPFDHEFGTSSLLDFSPRIPLGTFSILLGTSILLSLVCMWVEPYLSNLLYKSLQTMACAIRSPMQLHPSNPKLSVCLTGNEINKAYSNIKTDCCTLNLLLFCKAK